MTSVGIGLLLSFRAFAGSRPAHTRVSLPSAASRPSMNIRCRTSKLERRNSLNQVERFFALLSGQQIKRGAHRSVAEVEDAIIAYIKSRNAAPKPFRWTKSADDILASIERFCRRTLDTQAKCA
jgi:hypothetical protein